MSSTLQQYNSEVAIIKMESSNVFTCGRCKQLNLVIVHIYVEFLETGNSFTQFTAYTSIIDIKFTFIWLVLIILRLGFFTAFRGSINEHLF